MPAYDLRYDPPAAIALVAILNPASGAKTSDIPMLLDSGSDVTLIPSYLVDALGLQVDNTVAIDLEGFDGNRSLSGVVEVHLILETLTFRGRYVVTPSRLGVIGRDLLNFLTLTLKGPALQWDIAR